MKIILLKSLLLIVLLIGASNTFAEDEWYIAANGFVTDFEDEGNDSGYNVAIGKYLNKNVSVELGFADFGGDSDTLDGISSEFEATAIQLSAVAYLPLSENGGLFARFGVERVDTDGAAGTEADGTDDTNLYYGVGGYLEVSENIDVRLEVQRHEVLGDDVDTFSAGLVVKTF